MKWISGLAALILIVAAACNGSSALTVGEAQSASGDHSVSGFLLADGDSIRLCEALAESFPPQCGGASITVIGLDLATIDGLQTEQSTRWTDDSITISGTLANGTLDVG